MKLFFGNALWHLIQQSDGMTKSILLILVAVSVVCWSLIFYKIVTFKSKEKQIRETLSKLRRIRSRQDFFEVARQEQFTFSGHLISDYVHELTLAVNKNGLLSEREADYLDAQRFAVVDRLVYQEESYLSILSVAAASGPLVGLFGTVWGLTNSFISISEKQSADIVTIAPGMAEALVTTMAGLMVAIPMLVMFHYLNGRVRHIEHLLQQVSDQLQAQVQKLFKDVEEKHEGTVISSEAPKRSFVP